MPVAPHQPASWPLNACVSVVVTVALVMEIVIVASDFVAVAIVRTIWSVRVRA